MKPKQTSTKQGFTLLLFIVFVMLIPACIQSSPGNSYPEFGMTTWIDAVNGRDYHRLYTLAPNSIRQQIDETTFIQEQTGNPLFAGGGRITGYQILNQTLAGNRATITARLVLETPGEGGGNLSRKIPLYIKFLETFERGEWKVWTSEP